MTVDMILLIFSLILTSVRSSSPVSSRPLPVLAGEYNMVVSPQASETRWVIDLDGMWMFRTEKNKSQGFTEEWNQNGLLETEDAAREVIPMPVPASYNDITQHIDLRDYLGWVWYERVFFVPEGWANKRVHVRFGSVSFEAVVFVNGEKVAKHRGGHTPFDAYLGKGILMFAAENRITVAVRNVLSWETVPQGSMKNNTYYKHLWYDFDFFNYAGIHRPVKLVAMSNWCGVNMVKVTTSVAEDLNSATINYNVSYFLRGKNTTGIVEVQLLTKSGEDVAGIISGASGKIELKNSPRLWWPHTMHDDPGYLYDLKVVLRARWGDGKLSYDAYRQKVGLRDLKWNNTGIFINHRKFYLRGFGKHEDSDIRGKGLDLSLVAKDFNLMKWSGANSFRTSHYPYADEIMDMADELGFVVVDECPAVAIVANNENRPLKENHKRTLTELISRDISRPSVIAWSVANEPRLGNTSRDYFEDITRHVLSLDSTRMITAVLNNVEVPDMTETIDMVMLNKYYSWYSDYGHSEVIYPKMVERLRLWKEKFRGPTAVADVVQKEDVQRILRATRFEYGADTIAGFHVDPPTMFSEEYQVELMHQNHKAFDKVRKEGGLAGEMIWNFADFATKQQTTRVGGNKKGVFTRNRQPKESVNIFFGSMSAHVLRERYWALALQDAPEWAHVTKMPYFYNPPRYNYCPHEQKKESLHDDVKVEIVN